MISQMIICKECGVQLEDTMRICPLCNTPASNDASGPFILKAERVTATRLDAKKYLLGQILWQITAILLLSGIVATLTINLAIQGEISWSVYPISICLMILSYVSLMSLWRTRVTYQLAGGWILSSLVLVMANVLVSADWPLMIAFPILCAVNLVAFVVIFVLKILTTKGLNVFAVVILATAVLCLLIEGIISSYFESEVRLKWSAIVAACLLPVTATILFMYFRTRSNSDLRKIFHT